MFSPSKDSSMSVSNQTFEIKFLEVIKSFVFDFEESNDMDDPVLDHVDSLEFVEIVMDLEDKFNIEIPDAETEEIVTFNELKTLVKSKLSID